MTARDRLVVACDVESLEELRRLVTSLGDQVLWYKVGLELWSAAGPEAVRVLKNHGKRVFIDLKLHDIPNTVARACARLCGLGADLINMHVVAGDEAMRLAANAVHEVAPSERPALLGVTVLTSAKMTDGGRPFSSDEMVAEAAARAESAQAAGLDGVVAPAAAIGEIRGRCGPEFLILTPGIRPAGATRGDQQWIATPAGAIRAGARWIVVGRPITAADSPFEAAAAILGEMGGSI